MPFFRNSNGAVAQNHDDDDYDDDVKTSIIQQNNATPIPAASPTPPVINDDPKTQLLFDRGTDESVDNNMSDPVVGWIVIIDGPGKGTALELGYGMNSIGRSQQERICLNFGDEMISNTQQAIVTYDPRGRKFYVQHGGAKNLTYVNNAPLLVPTELHGNEEISMGQTTLRFVAFCGEHFDWQSKEESTSS